MTFEEWDAITPDYGQPGSYINGMGSTITIPSTRESRLRDYQNSLSPQAIDEIVTNSVQQNQPTLLTNEVGAVLDDPKIIAGSPDKTRFEMSIAKDGAIETKSQTIMSNGDTTEVKNKTQNDTDKSILDTVLSTLGMGEAKASTDSGSFITSTDQLETPVPVGVYQSDYFDDVSGELIKSNAIDPKQDNLTSELFDGTYNPDLYENPKYVIDGSGAFVSNPNYNPEVGQGTKSSAYPDTPEGDLNRIINKTPFDEVQSVMAALKIDTDTPITAESFKAELERQKKLQEIAASSILDTTEVPIVTEDKSKATEKEKEATEDMIQEAVKVIVSEQPNELTRLNDFALWADGVSDDQAIREAEAVLEQIANAPTVTDRFKKAMGIAFGAMLFGDDFATAMNTGLGVVADDYSAEATAAKEARDSQIALQQEIAKEQRALQNDLFKADYNSSRDAQEAITKMIAEYEMKLPEEERKAAAARMKENIDAGRVIMEDTINSIGEDKANFIDLDGEWAGLLVALEESKPAGFSVDVTEPLQRAALNGLFRKYITEQKSMSEYGNKAAPLASYAQEFFIKNELREFTEGMGAIDPNIVSPSRAYLEDRPFIGPMNSDGVRTKQVYVGNSKELGPLIKAGTEATQQLGTEIEKLGSSGLGERGTTILLYKDYTDFKKQSFDKGDGVFEEMEKVAYQKGWGPFTQFVLVHMKNKLTLDNIGKNFDSLLANEPEAIDVRALKMYMETGTYDLEQIKREANK